MLRQFCVGFVEPDLVLAVFVHAGFEIVTLEDSCDTTVIVESSHMGCGPTFLIHGKERFYISITAVGQRGHKDIRRNGLSGVAVNDRSGISGPVHLHDFTGLMIQMHCGIDFGCIVPVVLLELSQLGRAVHLPCGKPRSTPTTAGSA